MFFIFILCWRRTGKGERENDIYKCVERERERTGEGIRQRDGVGKWERNRVSDGARGIIIFYSCGNAVEKANTSAARW